MCTQHNDRLSAHHSQPQHSRDSCSIDGSLWISRSFLLPNRKLQDSSNCCSFLGQHSLRVSSCRYVLQARIYYMTHYHDCLLGIPVLFTVHWKHIVVIVWSSLSSKITWGIALFPTAVFLAFNHVQHTLHKRPSTQRVWHCACANAWLSRD